jgi:two-component system osmolarity sensor histidine kinase EnvZ
MKIIPFPRRLTQAIKSLLPHSLLGRSLMILIVPILLVQVIAMFIFFDRHWSKINARMAYAVAGEITLVAKSIEDGHSLESLNRMMSFAAHNLGLVISYQPDSDLVPLGPQPRLPFWETGGVDSLRLELAKRLGRPFEIANDANGDWFVVHMKLNKGVLKVSIPDRRLYTSSGYIFLLWMVGASFILLMIAIMFMRNQIRPIRKLAAASERFGKGRDVAFFKPEGAIEVRQAGQAFLDMQQRIRRQIEQRTTMLAGVSHDLRTPLTRLKLQLAMMGEGPDVAAMKQDISEMEKMIAGYLDFVRGDGDEVAVMTSVNDVLARVINSAERQSFKVRYETAMRFDAMLRPLAFERCLMNLVNNAGRYGQQIWIHLRAGQRAFEILVEDDGPGIPPEQYEDVFKPFYRADASRNSETGGVGLGLPIAQDIVHAHGGSITLKPSQHGGLCVVVSIPV